MYKKGDKGIKRGCGYLNFRNSKPVINPKQTKKNIIKKLSAGFK